MVAKVLQQIDIAGDIVLQVLEIYIGLLKLNGEMVKSHQIYINYIVRILQRSLQQPQQQALQKYLTHFLISVNY